jgi:hypothetical protein
MDGPARKEVSERMKRYWARRREERASQTNEEGRAAKPHAMPVQAAAAEAPLGRAMSA